MSPVQSLVLWEMKWYTSDTEWLIGVCEFCAWETTRLGTPATTGQLIIASTHDCPGHRLALSHYLAVKTNDREGTRFVTSIGQETDGR